MQRLIAVCAVLAITLLSLSSSFSESNAAAGLPLSECGRDIKLEYAGLTLNNDGVICLARPNSLLTRGHNVKHEDDGIFSDGDQIVALNGKTLSFLSVAERAHAFLQWERHLVGGTVTVIRDGKTVTLTLSENQMLRLRSSRFSKWERDLGRRLGDVALEIIVNASSDYEGIGVMFTTGISNPSLVDLTPGLVWRLVTMEGYPSPAREAGTKKGDRIAQINDVKIPTTWDRFRAADAIADEVRYNDGPFQILVERDRKALTFSVEKKLIFDGNRAEVFFRHRSEIQELSVLVWPYGNFAEFLYKQRMIRKGETLYKDGDGSVVPAHELGLLIARNVDRYEEAEKAIDSFRDSGREGLYWTEVQCLFFSDALGCAYLAKPNSSE